MITIVLLNVKAIATYNAEIDGNPSNLVITKPNIKVMDICPNPAIKATGPTSLITFGVKFNPTINNNKAIPISENNDIGA